MAEINEVIGVVGKAVIAQKEFLTALDQAIGDGDHGITICRGFKWAVKSLGTKARILRFFKSGMRALK